MRSMDSSREHGGDFPGLERLRAIAGKALRSGNLAVTWEDVSLSIAPGSRRESDLARELFATVEMANSVGRVGLLLRLE